MEPGVFNQEGKAPIHLAAARGHMGVVNYLLERGAFIDMQDFGVGITLYPLLYM